MSKDLVFDSSVAKPHQVIMYMLDEARRRTDKNAEGEFGILENGVMWHHRALAERIDAYIERLVQERSEAARSKL